MSKGLNLDTLVAIRESEGLTLQEKLALWTIYSRGQHHTGSMKTLARNMGYKDDRQARRIVASLRDRNIINVEEHSGGTHTISINTHVLQTLVPQDTPVSQDKGGMSPKTRGVCLPRHTKENDKENDKENLEASAGAAADKQGSTTEPKHSNEDGQPSVISEGKEDAAGGGQDQDSSSIEENDVDRNDSKEEPPTLVLQDKGKEAIEASLERLTEVNAWETALRHGVKSSASKYLSKGRGTKWAVQQALQDKIERLSGKEVTV